MAYGLPSWLTGSSTPTTATSTSTPPKSHDGGYIAPDRTKREACYESRDIFFSCLDKHDILDAVRNEDEAKSKCGSEHDDFARDCATSWIKYFKEKRVMEYNRDQTIARIQKDDAAAAARAKAEKKGGGWFS